MALEQVNPLDAKQLTGRARVKFEKQDGVAYIVFGANNELSVRALNLLSSTSATGFESTSNLQSEDNTGDSGSIWSVNLPKKHSSKIATMAGWGCVAWIIVMHLFHIIAVALQDGSAVWAIALFISGVLANEVPLYFLAFLLCACPSPIQAIFFLVAWATSFVVEFILGYVLPWWDKTFYYINLILIVIIIILLPFIRRVHLHFKSYHKKGNLLEMTVSLLRYYAVIMIAETIKYFSYINSIASSGQTITVILVSVATYSNLFAILSVLYIISIHAQYGRYPQAGSVFDLIGLMKTRDFFPFALVGIQLIVFTVQYVTAFANVDLDSTATLILTLVFYGCFLVIVIYLVAISVMKRPFS